MSGHTRSQSGAMGKRRPGSMGLRPTPKGHHSDQSAAAVVERLGGRLSYRMLDYWCRTGRVQLAVNGRGSGSRRVVSAAEEAALIDTLDYLEQTEAVLADINSGDYFRRRLEAHRGQP